MGRQPCARRAVRRAFTVKAREQTFQALWSADLSYNCSAVPRGVRAATDDTCISERGCAPAKLYLKAGVSQIWPVSYGLPTPSLHFPPEHVLLL